MKFLALADNRLVDRFQSARLELAERIANPPGAEVGRLLPVPDAEQDLQTAMVLGLILELVIIVVQAQPHGCVGSAESGIEASWR